MTWRDLMIVAAATMLIPTMVLAAVAVQTIQTWGYGPMHCLVGDAAPNVMRIIHLRCIQGLGGSDVLEGGARDDHVDAAYGDNSMDRLWGRGGRDRFYVGFGYAFGDPRIDRIMDMAAGEVLCGQGPFTSARATVQGTTGNHRHIVVRYVGGEAVIAWVANLGTKPISVRGGCLLRR